MAKKMTTTEARQAREALRDLTARLAEVQNETTSELQATWRELFGTETKSRNTPYLRRRIAARIQELHEAGEGVAAGTEAGETQPARATDAIRKRSRRRKAQSAKATKTRTSRDTTKAPEAPKPRDPRLPEPGETIRKIYKGEELEVLVLDEGFEFRGEKYRSLSKIARDLTGTSWNGFLFFGLTKRPERPRAATKKAEEATS